MNIRKAKRASARLPFLRDISTTAPMIQIRQSIDMTDWRIYLKGSSGICYSAFVGARYHFNDKFAAYGEIGYGISALELGISFKL